MAAHIMNAAGAPGGLHDAQDRIAGIQKAATILMQRLYAKDPRRWVQVAMMSPPELIPWPEQPDLSLIGLRVKAWLDENRGRALAMNREGVAIGLTPIWGGVAINSASRKKR